MKHKLLAAALSVLMALACVQPLVSYAETKIQKVTVKFSIDDYDEKGYPEITASTSGNYSCGSVDLYSDDDDLDLDSSSVSDSTYVVELSADEGYVFNLTKASQVTLKGGGAKYVKATRQDSGTTLLLYVQFENLEDICSPVDSAGWKDNGVASWEAAYNAQKYKLVLTGPSVSKIVYTGGTTYDFRPLMLKEGTYSYSVRPISKTGYTAESANSGGLSVSAEQAEANRQAYEVETEHRVIDTESGVTGPSNVEAVYKNTGWKQDDTGWWYQNDDGTYLQYDWLEYDGSWYFFGSDGYMVTNRIIKWGSDEYYVGSDGRMVINAKIPDGRKAGSDGLISGQIDMDALIKAVEEGLLEDDNSYYGPAFASVSKTEDIAE